MRWLRYILSAPLNLFWSPEDPEEIELYDFVHIAFFHMFWAGLVWWCGVIGFVK
jgi:hypothetical protein